jgi:cytochrome c556
VVLLAAFALALAAQKLPEFALWKKVAAGSMKALEKAQTGPEAVRQAERLGVIYENMVHFWRQKDETEAVKWSVQGKAAAVRLAGAAKAEKAEEAGAMFKELQQNCQSCHEAFKVAPQ